MPEAVACPRHPRTQTRLRCTRCDEVICPDCMVPAASGFICPSCAKADRASAPKVRAVGARASTPATWVLLVLIGIVAVATATQGGMDLGGGLFGGATELHGQFAFFGPAVAGGEWWRVLTASLLHYGPFHLAMNAYGLVILGPQVESRLGAGRFLLLWLVSVVGAGAGSALLEPYGLAAGASGGLFGLLAALVLLERRRGVRRLMESQAGVWLVMGVVMTFAVPGISVGGHLGGAVGGAMAALALFEFERPGQRCLGVLGASAVGIAAAGLILVGVHLAFGP